MLEKKPYPVEKIVTHIAPHSDELDAIELARTEEGREAFPGVENAPVYLIDAGLHEKGGRDGDVRLVEDKTFCPGVNGGEFDEHAVPAAQRRGHTALSRTARWLGLQDRPAIKAIIEYSLRTDRVRTDRRVFKGPFEIPHLVKAWWTAEFTLTQVLQMYHIIFCAIYANLSGSTPVAEPEPGAFRRLIAQWFVLRFGTKAQKSVLINQFSTGEEAALLLGRTGEDVHQILELDARDVQMVGPKFDFELEGIWEAMIRTGVPVADRNRVVFGSLNAKYEEQVAFLAACEELKAHAYVPTEQSPYSVVIIKSDSNLMNRAARFTDPDIDVLIQFRTSGRYLVFDLHMRLEMNAVAMQLRIGENEVRGRTDHISIELLLSDGTLVQVPECFFWEEGHAAFNGTLTAKRTPVTKMNRHQIIKAVLNGLAFIDRRYGVMSKARWRESQRDEMASHRAIRLGLDKAQQA